MTQRTVNDDNIKEATPAWMRKRIAAGEFIVIRVAKKTPLTTDHILLASEVWQGGKCIKSRGGVA